MTLKAPKGTTVKRELLPNDELLNAVCSWVIDLGTQEKMWDWKTKLTRQVKLVFEFPELLIEIEWKQVPRTKSITFTLSLWSKSTLYKVLKSWLNKAPEEDLDLMELIGKWALIQIQNSDTNAQDWIPYQNINNILPNKKQYQINNEIRFSFDSFNKEAFEKLSKWDKETVMKSQEYKENGFDMEAWVQSEELPF